MTDDHGTEPPEREINPGIEVDGVRVGIHVIGGDDSKIGFVIRYPGKTLVDTILPRAVCEAIVTLLARAGVAPSTRPIIDLSMWTIGVPTVEGDPPTE